MVLRPIPRLSLGLSLVLELLDAGFELRDVLSLVFHSYTALTLRICTCTCVATQLRTDTL